MPQHDNSWVVRNTEVTPAVFGDNLQLKEVPTNDGYVDQRLTIQI